MDRNLLIKMSLTGIGLCLLVIIGSFFVEPPKFKAPEPEVQYNPSGNFTLTGDTGKPFHLKDLRGKVVLLFFGYTSCPDACPSTLSKLHRALNLLPTEQVKQVRTVFISVDPDRDDPQLLKDYVDYFGINAIGLTGTKGEIDKVVKSYQAHYLKIPGETGHWYSINHTTTVYLHDKHGKVRHLFLYDDPPEKMAAKLREFI